jgi:hypothetical protein
VDIVKGAQILAELFEERGTAPPEAPPVESSIPLYRWVGVAPAREEGEPEGA